MRDVEDAVPYSPCRKYGCSRRGGRPRPPVIPRTFYQSYISLRRLHYGCGVMEMETSSELWELFCETGEPMVYLHYRLAADAEAEDAISPSA